jgi:hypothetical protein
MKRLFFLIISAVVYYSVSAQDIDKAWVLKNYTKIERQIPMRDQ